MNHLGLFEGIGGFSLAARWMGWQTLAWCEWNDFGQKVLRHHFPEAEGFSDIRKSDFTKYANRIDILTGGFPCQPFSTAGKRKGTEDDRHLWPEMLRVIREVKPRFVVAENVRGILNIEGGMVFEQVCADLESEGYEVQSFIIPACSLNAPHRRDRVWFVAYSNDKRNPARLTEIQRSDEKIPERNNDAEFSHSNNRATADTSSIGFRGDSSGEQLLSKTHRTQFGMDGATADTESERSERMQFRQREISQQKQREFRGSGCENDVANTDSGRQPRKEHRQATPGWVTETSLPTNWQNFPTQPPVCGGDDGIPRGLDGITFPKWRNESIKAYGNAIVPQIAYEIFKAIELTQCSKT